MDSTRYYYSMEGKTFGPLSIDELKDRVRAGQLRPDIYIIPFGGTQWIPFVSVAGTEFMQAVQRNPFQSIIEAIKTAGAAFLKIAINPVGNLEVACEMHKPGSARITGVIFASFVFVCYMFCLIPLMFYHTFGGFLASFIHVACSGIFPFASYFCALMVVRSIAGTRMDADKDVFLAGASVLPSLFGCIGLIIFNRIALMSAIYNAFFIMAVALSVLMLFSGMCNITKVSGRVALWATVTAVVVSNFLVSIFTVLAPRY